ncbi:MAG: transglutaminase TgpA family protein [Acidimicrobiia bacterium]
MSVARSGWYAACALAALTIAAALGLGRVFADGSFALPIIGAALLPHAVGAFARTRRWHGAVLVLVTVAIVLLYVTWVIAPSTTTYGIPGSGTIETLAHRLADGWHVFRTGRSPVPVTDGVLLLCMVLTAVVAATADALAFRSEATLAAIVPSLLLFVFASTLGTTELRTATTIGYAIVALVFLMLQHQALLESHRSWCSGRRAGSQATLLNAAALVGGAALLVGIVIAPALPGVDDGPMLDYRSFGASSASGPTNFRTLSPLVDLRARLTEQPDEELFTVSAPRRLYWRIAALDRFDGTIWGIESQARDVGEELARKRPAGTVRQQFTITRLTDQWLPAAYEPRATDLENARVVPESGTLIAPDRGISGLTYRVDSRVAQPPTPGEIAGTVAPVPARLRSSLELPGSFPESVRRRAQRIVAGASTPYAKAKALQGFFLDGSFTYDLSGPSGSSSDAITNFLNSRRGFCEQFAGAFAAMARSVGLPARVAVGFAPGSYDSATGEFSVRARDAHAWPEVWLAGLGWTQFEPTPAGNAPGQADGTAGQAATTNPTPATTTATRATSSTTASPSQSSSSLRRESEVQAGSPASAGTGSSNQRWWILGGVGALAVLAAIGWLVMRAARKVRRRTRRRQTTIPSHSVAGAWQDALERLTDAGLPPSETLTPHEQASGYAQRGAPSEAADSLQDLADLYARAGWSLREPTEDDVARAWTDADSVRAALAEGVSSRERVRRALRL